jgi:hypothetical protein
MSSAPVKSQALRLTGSWKIYLSSLSSGRLPTEYQERNSVITPQGQVRVLCR